MIGGETDAVQHLDPIFSALAPGIGTIERTHGREGRDPRAEQGYIHAGPVGAGHFVKMIHNGIEYGMMQAMAEGFDILRNRRSDKLPADERFDLNMADIAEVWRRGSVVSSWLLDLTAERAGERRAAGEILRLSSMIPAKAAGPSRRRSRKRCRPKCSPPSLFVRFRSRQDHTFAEKILSADALRLRRPCRRPQREGEHRQ